jgi:hypothetical protein
MSTLIPEEGTTQHYISEDGISSNTTVGMSDHVLLLCSVTNVLSIIELFAFFLVTFPNHRSS